MGHNTDIAGFLGALRSVRKEGAAGARCLVAGAGGAARAVVAALMAGGAEAVFVYNRTPERAETLCRAASTWGKGVCEAVAATSLSDVVHTSDVIVNATSVGLADSVKKSSIPVDSLDGHHVVVDLVYGRRDTALVSQAVLRGAVAIGGLEMLLKQAAASYELWTGLKAPLDVMRDSVA
jgi:shikimate dehydrogenase